VRRPDAFEEDCRRAVVVVSTRTAPPDCAALVVDRAVWQRGGAIALRRAGGNWDIMPARPPGLDRPWARGRHAAEESPAAAAPQRREPRDATPRADDMEPGD
jgi:competence protein ComEC